ncbi:MAG: 5-formyltetrahydrofolate cyclo-ligase [Rickettsiales bacterium]
MFLKSKQEIRKIFSTQRDALSGMDKNELEKIIIGKISKIIEPFLKTHKKIALYYPINSELSLLNLTKKRASRYLLPVIDPSSKILKFYSWSLGEELISSNAFASILEPKIQQQEEMPDIVIAPLIASDIQGNRIGSGKGFYDYTIAELKRKNPRLIYLGVCFNFQLVDELIHEIHDQKLDIIITDKREIYCKS